MGSLGDRGGYWADYASCLAYFLLLTGSVGGLGDVGRASLLAALLKLLLGSVWVGWGVGLAYVGRLHCLQL